MPNRHGQPVITIDGTSASGKSTLSEDLAAIYGAKRLEYSVFFRLIGLHMLDNGFTPTAGTVVTQAHIAEAEDFARNLTWERIEQIKRDDRLRTIDVSRAAPFFSGIPEVLASTDTALQHLIDASRDKPVIAEGRTLGKYVYPEADVKLFVDADIALRGERRAATLNAKGKNVTPAEVAADLAERDRQDQTRAYQPTGFDASVHTRLDTSHQTIPETLREAMDTIERTLPALEARRNSATLNL